MARTAYEEARIRKIRNKYGANIFHTWGLKGGSPILLRYARKKAQRKRR